jgi:hypothetical protein
MKPLYLFGDIVVVDIENIGVIVKSWGGKAWQEESGYHYEVYVRMYNAIKNYSENEIERYRVRHKYLSQEELEYQAN